MTRDEITPSVLAARLARGLSWQDPADAISKPVVRVVAALARATSSRPADPAILATKLGLSERAAPILAAAPTRGALPAAALTDPTLGRVYGSLRGCGSTAD